jgi:hypothetical protein
MNCFRDQKCAEKGIPRHLHRLKRKRLSNVGENDSFYRRLPLHRADITEAISFDQSKNSVNRKKLCRSPEDVFIDPDTGVKKTGLGILEIPQNVFHNKKWGAAPNVFVTSFDHDPLACNYAHYNMIITSKREGKPTKSLRLEIRRAINAVAVIVVPTPLHGYRLAKEKGGGSIYDPSMTIPPPLH